MSTAANGQEVTKRELDSASGPSGSISSSLPLGNVFYLMIVLMVSDLKVELANQVAFAAQLQTSQSILSNQLLNWTAQTSALTQGIDANGPNSPHNYTQNGAAIGVTATASALMALGISFMASAAATTAASGGLAAAAGTALFIVGLILLVIGTLLLGVAQGLGNSTSSNCFNTDSGIDMSKAYGLVQAKDADGKLLFDSNGNPVMVPIQDSNGDSITLTALQQILPTDQAQLQQTQNTMSSLQQTGIGPAQDMQQQDGQMVQNALRLMQAVVAQTSV